MSHRQPLEVKLGYLINGTFSFHSVTQLLAKLKSTWLNRLNNKGHVGLYRSYGGDYIGKGRVQSNSYNIITDSRQSDGFLPRQPVSIGFDGVRLPTFSTPSSTILCCISTKSLAN